MAKKKLKTMDEISVLEVRVPTKAEVLSFKPLSLEAIASRNGKTVEEVQQDFAACHFYGELADKYKVSFADAYYWMQREHGVSDEQLAAERARQAKILS